MILLAAAGALSMLAQVVVLRELVAALFGVELLYVLALGSWLVGTGIGAAAGRFIPASARTAVGGCLALGLMVPLELVMIRAMGPMAGALTGAYLPFPMQLVWIVVATFPPAAVCGWLFPVLAGALAAGRGLSAGRSYAVESAGAAAGGAGVTIAIGLGASTFQVALAAPALAVVAVAAAAGRWPRRVRVLLALLAAAPVLLGAVLGGPWDLALLRLMYPPLVDASDTPYARVAVLRQASQIAVFENGALAFDTEGVSAEAFADLAALQHDRPARALVIGGGGEGVPDALMRHGLAVVDNVEVDERGYRLVRSHTAGLSSLRTGDRQVRVYFDEPRRYLARTAPYDLILVAAGEPASGASSRFYTREFFALCANRLTRGGVVALRLAAAENVWPRPLILRTSSIVAAVRQEFHAVELVPGATLYVFASNGPLSTDPAVFADRLRRRRLAPRLITPPYLQYLYTNDRRREVAALIGDADGGRPNRDGAPVCFQYAALTWLSTFYPGLAAASDRARFWPAPAGWAVLACVAVAVATWARRRRNRRIAASLLTVGFIGMVLETVLLLRFQIANGVVYGQVGWLLTCFMGGMAAGGYAARPGGTRQGPAVAIPVITAGVSLLALAAILWVPASAGLPGTSVLLAGTGAAVGCAFAVGAGLWEGQTRIAASSLYAADVVGGAAGALAGTFALVPAAGLDGSAAVAVAAAAALFAIIPRCGPAAR